MYTVYILYSATLDRYYVGFTSQSVHDRLQKHLGSHSGFTSKVKDWKIVFSESHQTKQDATQREKEIKSWKSRRKIEELIGSTEQSTPT
ncbi:MAG: GIY-YIG nuclease family protein [Lacibacter sp.]